MSMIARFADGAGNVLRALLALPLCAAGAADVRVAADGKSITHLAWDTEGDGRSTNLLRRNTPVTLSAGTLSVKQNDDGGFEITISGDATAQLRFPFDPRVSAVTILPAKIDGASGFHLPAIVWAPG